MLRVNLKLRRIKRIANKIRYQQKLEYNKKKSNFPLDMNVVRDWKKNPDRKNDFLL